jgi:hypothetical protein
MNLDRIARWEEKFLQGDHSDDAWLLALLHAETTEDRAPLLFRIASTIEAFQFLRDNGVNLIQRDDSGSTFLMEPELPLERDAYRWLADEFKARGAIDLADEEGFTALSGKIKFAEFDKARILLERGASVNSFATVARYGGARITVADQAVVCMPSDNIPQESAAIAALQLLQEFGYRPDKDEVQQLLISVAEEKARLRDWISQNLG